jgi:hypothetical protein
VYLGPAGPIVDEARQALGRLQAPRRQRRTIDAARQALRRELAKARIELDAELARFGLQRKGSEIRRWTGPLAADRPLSVGSPERFSTSRVTKAAASRAAVAPRVQLRREAATESA